jgi:hypothetical protein
MEKLKATTCTAFGADYSATCNAPSKIATLYYSKKCTLTVVSSNNFTVDKCLEISGLYFELRPAFNLNSWAA